MEYISLLLIPFFAHIIFTDFKEYKISLVTVVIAGVLSFIRFYTLMVQTMIVQTLILNSMLMIILLSVLFVYCRIRKLKLLNAFGIGDILFMILAIVNFAPLSFLLFIIFSSFGGILFFLIRKNINSEIKHIPFAGIMAALLLILLVLETATSFSTLSDNWIFKLLA